MHVKQKLAILFYLKRQKVDKKGKIPVYVRVYIGIAWLMYTL